VDAANLRERVPLFTINQGETVLVNILRICRLLSAYPVALGDGRLTLARPGSERVTGEPIQLGGEGSSVLAWSYGKSFLERFSIVDVRGQSQDYDPFTRSLIRPRGRATDAAVTRYRPLVIISDVPGAEGDFSQRARQEVAWRRGDSERISYTMQGWRQPGTGLIWRPGMTVAVLDSINDIQGERLVSSVNLSRNEGGTFTELTLVALDTYQVPR
jgi:prophage tail gpP-like protein